jgi:hypothetical protein
VSEPTAAGPLPPLERLGDYRIIREIGHGGMGRAYAPPTAYILGT